MSNLFSPPPQATDAPLRAFEFCRLRRFPGVTTSNKASILFIQTWRQKNQISTPNFSSPLHLAYLDKTCSVWPHRNLQFKWIRFTLFAFECWCWVKMRKLKWAETQKRWPNSTLKSARLRIVHNEIADNLCWIFKELYLLTTPALGPLVVIIIAKSSILSPSLNEIYGSLRGLGSE